MCMYHLWEDSIDYWWAYDIAYQATEDSAYKINEDFVKQPIKNPTTWLLRISPIGQGFWTAVYTGKILY